jgi:hypothetical protein
MAVVGAKQSRQTVKNVLHLDFFSNKKSLKINLNKSPFYKKHTFCSVWAVQKMAPRGPSKGSFPKQKRPKFVLSPNCLAHFVPSIFK